MEFILLAKDRAVVSAEVPFRLMSAEAFDFNVAQGERPFSDFRIRGRGTWDVIMAAWHALPDRYTGNSLYTHFVKCRDEAMRAHAHPIGDAAHVVIHRADIPASDVTVVHMRAPDESHDFKALGFQFAWRGKRIRVRRASSGQRVVDLWSYDQPTDVSTGGYRFVVVIKRSAADVSEHVATLGFAAPS